MIKAFSGPRDIALKLFRECGRTWNSRDLESMGDHLYNFCVTHLSLRDWVIRVEGFGKESLSAYHEQWRLRANGLFGVCADIGNASKHFLIDKKASAGFGVERLVVISPNGLIDGSGFERGSFVIKIDNGLEFCMFDFLNKICSEWELIFLGLPGQVPLPEHGYYMVVMD